MNVLQLLVPSAAKPCSHFVSLAFGYILRESIAPLFSESLSVQLIALRFPRFFLFMRYLSFCSTKLMICYSEQNCGHNSIMRCCCYMTLCPTQRHNVTSQKTVLSITSVRTLNLIIHVCFYF